MATETVLDYLGHPCRIAEAFERFDEPVKDARKLEPRALVRQIGIQLTDIQRRAEDLGAALELAHDSLNDVDEGEKVRALLAMVIPFEMGSAEKYWSLAGLVLVALEHGKLLEANHG